MSDIWVKEGYRFIAEKGFDAFNVKSFAKSIHKSKSSFYYKYGDYESYQVELLEYHVLRTAELVSRINQFTEANMELLDVWVEYKIDFNFHKQLRINRENPLFKSYIEKTQQSLEDVILPFWNEHLRLTDRPLLGKAIFQLIADNFILRVNMKNMTAQWMLEYINEILYILYMVEGKDK